MTKLIVTFRNFVKAKVKWVTNAEFPFFRDVTLRHWLSRSGRFKRTDFLRVQELKDPNF
jgi:hypothetical protein